MTRKKIQAKSKNIKEIENKEYFRFGNFTTVIIISIWALIVFNNYFKSQPVSLQFLNIPDIFLFIKRIFQVISEEFQAIL